MGEGFFLPLVGGKEEVGGVKNSREKKRRVELVVSPIGNGKKSVVRFLEIGKKRETRRWSEFVAAADTLFLGGRFLGKKGRRRRSGGNGRNTWDALTQVSAVAMNAFAPQ